MGTSGSVVRSLQNSRIKQLRKYLKFPQAAETPWIGVEGAKAISEVEGRLPLRMVVFSEDYLPGEPGSEADCRLQVSSTVFRNLSSLHSPTGVLAFFQKPVSTWPEMPPFVLYLDRLQDPGNLGTLLRCAAAAGQVGLVASPGTVSRFNSKAVRASAGTLFRVPMREGEPVQELLDRGYRLVAADPDQGESLFSLDLSPPLAIIVGNEGQGISPEVQALAQEKLRIPVEPGAPSLNAAIAGAVILFELRRRSDLL